MVSDIWTPLLVVLSRKLRNVCCSEFKAFQYNEESACTISPRPLVHRGFGECFVGGEKRGWQCMKEQEIERKINVENE